MVNEPHVGLEVDAQNEKIDLGQTDRMPPIANGCRVLYGETPVHPTSTQLINQSSRVRPSCSVFCVFCVFCVGGPHLQSCKSCTFPYSAHDVQNQVLLQAFLPIVSLTNERECLLSQRGIFPAVVHFCTLSTQERMFLLLAGTFLRFAI